jgi:hypothetical protein
MNKWTGIACFWILNKLNMIIIKIKISKIFWFGFFFLAVLGNELRASCMCWAGTLPFEPLHQLQVFGLNY